MSCDSHVTTYQDHLVVAALELHTEQVYNGQGVQHFAPAHGRTHRQMDSQPGHGVPDHCGGHPSHLPLNKLLQLVSGRGHPHPAHLGDALNQADFTLQLPIC